MSTYTAPSGVDVEARGTAAAGERVEVLFTHADGKQELVGLSAEAFAAFAFWAVDSHREQHGCEAGDVS